MIATSVMRKFTSPAFCACAAMFAANCCGPSRAASPAMMQQQQAPTAPPPQSQSQPPEPQPEPPASPPSANSFRTHTIKVWTNEDLIATRTAADIYLFAKEANEAAEQAAAFQSLTSCFAPQEPEPTAEETQKAIDDTTQAIREADDAVRQAKQRLADDPGSLRTRDQAEFDRLTAERNRLLDQLHTLQDRLQQSTPRPTGEKAPTAPTAPPQ
jgi:hypothetical protein